LVIQTDNATCYFFLAVGIGFALVFKRTDLLLQLVKLLIQCSPLLFISLFFLLFKNRYLMHQRFFLHLQLVNRRLLLRRQINRLWINTTIAIADWLSIERHFRPGPALRCQTSRSVLQLA